VFAAVVLGVLMIAQRRSGPQVGTAPRLSDPYLIATLRAGGAEAFLVSLISLFARGLLQVRGDSVVTVDGKTPALVRHPLEKAMLSHFAVAQEIRVPHGGDVALACTALEAELERTGLLANAAERSAQEWRASLAAFVLWGVAAAKILIAFSREHRNVGFLILLGLASGLVALYLPRPRRTPAGAAALDDVKRLFAGLESRMARTKPDADEVALLAAVLGADALPEGVFPARELLPSERARRRAATQSSSSCGSGCGSSSSASCGGGGGSCSGGCGGCGS
jgi:uncharacterized protein (TIGR04222 family)